MPKKLTQEEVIKRFKKAHGDRYEYSLVKYKDIHTKVDILCRLHGVFQQSPAVHSKGHGCPRCSAEEGGLQARLTKEEFLVKAASVHGDTYDYSRSRYTKTHDHITIICRTHGEFSQTPSNHLKGSRCPKCARKASDKKRRKFDKRSFIIEASIKHGNKYDYSLVNCVTKKEKVKIICPTHGAFEQSIYSHLKGFGCRRCSDEVNRFRERYLLKTPAILYYIKVVSDGKTYYKVGVTSRKIEERFRNEIKNGLDITPLDIKYFPVGGDAYKKETEIIKKYSKYKTNDSPFSISGNTETFDKDILCKDVSTKKNSTNLG